MSDSGDSIAFLDGTYEEALKLTREARDYLAVQESNDLARLAPEARLVASCETMRLTSRLSQVMAWLLVQKAVHAGEMARDAALRVATEGLKLVTAGQIETPTGLADAIHLGDIVQSQAGLLDDMNFVADAIYDRVQ